MFINSFLIYILLYAALNVIFEFYKILTRYKIHKFKYKYLFWAHIQIPLSSSDLWEWLYVFYIIMNDTFQRMPGRLIWKWLRESPFKRVCLFVEVGIEQRTMKVLCKYLITELQSQVQNNVLWIIIKK